jgi:hypothetical protein
MYETTIESNGSKWAGQEPDPIEKLIEVLKTEVIENRFFGKYKSSSRRYENGQPVKYTICPISRTRSTSPATYIFFGNFEAVSHVFRIYTNDPAVVDQLKTAIMNNQGWKKYFKRLKTFQKD